MTEDRTHTIVHCAYNIILWAGIEFNVAFYCPSLHFVFTSATPIFCTGLLLATFHSPKTDNGITQNTQGHIIAEAVWVASVVATSALGGGGDKNS